METQTEKKMPLSRLENRELRAYVFISRQVDIKVMNEGVSLIFSFDLDKAMEKVFTIAPLGSYIKPMGYMLVKDLINKIEVGEATTIISQAEPIKKEITKEQFICNLKLIADQFLEGEDKEKLKEIISRIDK